MRVVSLASSSKYGNTYLISQAGSTILVDCGLSIRKLEERLRELHVSPAHLDGVFITHEHVDHIRALQLRTPFPKKYGIRAFAPRILWRAARNIDCVPESLRYSFDEEETIDIGRFLVRPFYKPHDSAASVGFRVEGPDGTSAVVLTDLGEVPERVLEHARNADYYIIESNHDYEMEIKSNRPAALIARVLGRHGHLSNRQAGQALRSLVTGRTRGVMLAHLSLDCNTPHLAINTVAPFLRQAHFSGVLEVAKPEGVTVLSDSADADSIALF